MKVLQIFSFRLESHADPALHVSECCLAAGPLAVLTAAFTNMERRVIKYFLARRNHFKCHHHVYRVVYSPDFVFVCRLLRDLYNSGLPPNASLVAALHGRDKLTDDALKYEGYAMAQWAEALRYKPEVRGFDSRWSHWNFSVT